MHWPTNALFGGGRSLRIVFCDLASEQGAILIYQGRRFGSVNESEHTMHFQMLNAYFASCWSERATQTKTVSGKMRLHPPLCLLLQRAPESRVAHVKPCVSPGRVG